MSISHIWGEDPKRASELLSMLDLSEAEAALIKAARPQLEVLSQSLQDDFLEHLSQNAELQSILTPEHAQLIGPKLEHYFSSLVSGDYDEAYVRGRLQVGTVHQLLGVESKWYLGAYRRYLANLSSKVYETFPDDTAKAQALVAALVKVVFFDISLAMDAYMAAERKEIFRSREISVRAIEILQNTVPDDNIDYLTALVKQVSESLGVRYTFVVRVEGPLYNEGRVIAGVDSGEPIPGMTYSLAGTPCHNVFHGSPCVHPNSVQTLFPDDHLLVEMSAESYAGIPIHDRWGHTIGLLVVVDDKAIEDPGRIEQILLMIGGRVAAEVVRSEMDKELEDTMAKLEFHATRDDLTGLPNRVLFRDRLHQAVFEAQRNTTSVALFHVDIDDFKLVNDSLGHAAGDSLLIETAKRIKSCVRQGDTVARVGGDEFMVILRDISDLACTSLIAEKIQDAMRQPFMLTEDEHHQNTSMGISIAPQDTTDEDVLIRYADIAVHRAKELGRANYQFFSQDMSERTMHRVQLEKMLRSAIENEEFVVFYQPITDLQTRQLIGAEALVRWIHPEKGLIPPDKFIPISETTKLIIPLGQWIINQVCRDLAQINALGNKKLSFAINISPAQIGDRELLSVIKSALSMHSILPEQVVLEITENMFLYDVEYTYSLLKEFKDVGLRLSLDDFGTGYSSLSYLKKYPFDKVKIDRSFVNDLPEDTDDAAIAIATISMAHALGLSVVAEGVETKNQADYLQRNACDFVQGYYFARPMPLDEFIEKYRGELHN